MCSRFTATFSFREIKVRCNLYGDVSFEPRYNIAPSQDVPVIVRNEDRDELRSMRWGLVPSWSQDSSIGNRMINARAETLLQKSSFKDLVSRRRCLVPADGFDEWRSDGKSKVPMWIHLKNREPFAFPGLWDCWLNRDTGNELYSFTIVTTRPNDLLRTIHDRMPVIYDAAMGRNWPETSFGGPAIELGSILQPISSELMEAQEVSTLVNSPENDSPACVQLLYPDKLKGSQLPLL